MTLQMGQQKNKAKTTYPGTQSTARTLRSQHSPTHLGNLHASDRHSVRPSWEGPSLCRVLHYTHLGLPLLSQTPGSDSCPLLGGSHIVSLHTELSGFLSPLVHFSASQTGPVSLCPHRLRPSLSRTHHCHISASGDSQNSTSLRSPTREQSYMAHGRLGRSPG